MDFIDNSDCDADAMHYNAFVTLHNCLRLAVSNFSSYPEFSKSQKNYKLKTIFVALYRIAVLLLQIPLFASPAAAAGPQASTSVSSIDFGVVNEGFSGEFANVVGPKYIIITNTGNSPLTIQSLSRSSEFPNLKNCSNSSSIGTGFQICVEGSTPIMICSNGTAVLGESPLELALEVVLQTGETCSFPVIFAPSKLGVSEGNISFATDDPAYTNIVVPLRGAAIANMIRVSKPPGTAEDIFDFFMAESNIKCGFTNIVSSFYPNFPNQPNLANWPPGFYFPYGQFSFTTGGECASGSPIIFQMSSDGAFPDGLVYWYWGPSPENLTPHWQQLPLTIDQHHVSFSITDGGTGDADLTVNGVVTSIGGVGLPPPPPLLAPSSVDFGEQAMGTTSDERIIELTNDGPVALTLTKLSVSTSYSHTTTCGTTIASKNKCLIRVRFRPELEGSVTGMLTIEDDAIGKTHTVALSGSGTKPTQVSEGNSSSGGGCALRPNDGHDSSLVLIVLIASCRLFIQRSRFQKPL